MIQALLFATTTALALPAGASESPARPDLATAFRAAAPARGAAWIAWEAPVNDPGFHSCCYHTLDAFEGTGTPVGRCALEGEGSWSVSRGDEGTARRSPDSHRSLVVFVRVENGRTGRVRHVSDDCPVDTGRVPVKILRGVQPNESVAFLAALVTSEDGDERRYHGALSAIAMHEDASANRALERFATQQADEKLREKAAFWLGNARGRAGWEILKRIVPGDPSPSFRKKAAFAISQSPVPEALGTLIGMAKNDLDGDVRRQAIFWLAQKAGQKAVGAISEAIENDPETRVKEHAVFALSQLPNDEGIPKLIEVARHNRSPEVRKKAFFWLGQSHDPRAAAFIEEVLLK